LGALFFYGVTTDLIKRREVYKHFKKKEEISQNNIEPYSQQNKIQSSADSKKENINFNSKKVISDFDEFYYDNEQFEIQYKINKEKNEKQKESFNHTSSFSSRRSLRNTNSSAITINNNVNINSYTKEIKPKVINYFF